MGRGDARGDDHAVVVGVGHDERADEAGADAPARRPGQFLLVLAREKLDAAGAREKFCPRKWEVPAWIALRSCTIASMVNVCTAPGKPLALRFLAGKDRDGEVIAREGLVDAQHLFGLLAGLRLGLVRGMAFLPEELRGAQEQAGPHFPADDVRPLVDQDRQVAVRLHPFGIGRADDRLATSGAR